MKNINRLFAATVALLSVSALSMTSGGLLPTVVPANEDASVRVNLGVHGGLNGIHGGQGTAAEFGLTSLGGGIGFTHLVGYDFEYGLSVAASNASLYNNGKLWNDKYKDITGLRLDADLMMRYMPEMAERLRAGLVLGFGYGDQFTGAKDAREARGGIGDFYVKPGIAMNYAFTSAVAASLGVSYSLHNIRFNVKDATVKEHGTNWSGIDIPVSLWFGVAESTGLFIQANTRFTNFKHFARSFREEVSLGVSYAI